MKTTLIYNPQSGTGFNPGPDEIMDALRQIGYEPNHIATASELDLDRALADVQDLVVVAGGDGTIRAVATRLLGSEVKIAPVPVGTANNIARTLNLIGRPLEIVAGLADPIERSLDIGRAQTPDGPIHFLEAMGVGAFADVLKRYEPRNGKSIARSIQSMLDTMIDYQPKFFHLNLDGEDLSGSYLLVEVMNTPTLSLRYTLAPHAEADDGLFDLVLIHANDRDNYLKFMTATLMGTLDGFPAISMQKGRKLEIAWRGFPMHVDGEVVSGAGWIERYGSSVKVEDSNLLDVPDPHLNIEVVPKAIHFLVPRSTTKEGAG